MLQAIFHRRGRGFDLEAVETALRSALRRAGAAGTPAIPGPRRFERRLPCACGQQARYRELRSKPVLTAVGPVEVARPSYGCPGGHAGQFSVDVELDIENTQFSPGVRRMQAMVGQEAPLDHGREQLKVLAGLVVTAKSVERTAEAIGADIAQREQAAIQKTLPWDLPVRADQPMPVQMDGTRVPVVKKETLGGRARSKSW
ncbi:MAG TPA: hypothetical protein VG028_10670 [Terriglobia bacterium]|nr:hypothetical protein [Terriglobia bacterium]